jgi:hypothetical protein
MISFDLECSNKHRFVGSFKDYQAFNEQLTKGMIECPACGDAKIKRLFTGCSIQSGAGASLPDNTLSDKTAPNIFEMMRIVREYVINNFENVGRDFTDTARAIYYGVEEERNIYGESTPQEIKELIDEGVNVLPILPIDEIEN